MIDYASPPYLMSCACCGAQIATTPQQRSAMRRGQKRVFCGQSCFVATYTDEQRARSPYYGPRHQRREAKRRERAAAKARSA